MATTATAAAAAPEETVDQIEQEAERLKYLGFVHTAAIQASQCFSKLYLYAKDNSGPLKPSVDGIEGAVVTLVSPVYVKLQSVPLDLLKLTDRKVGESFQRVPPATAKAASNAAGIARSAYARCEPAAERCAASAWRSLNRVPHFPQVAQAVILPAADYWTERYNRAVSYSVEQGYAVSAYLPLIPKERIARVFSGEDVAPLVGEAH